MKIKIKKLNEHVNEGFLRDFFNSTEFGKDFNKISKIAKDRWPEEGLQGWPWHYSDAHRHILASAYFANKLGRGRAKTIGSSHEIKGAISSFLNPGGARRSGLHSAGSKADAGWAMDHANNEIGYDLAKKYPGETLDSYNRIVEKIVQDGDFFVEDGKTKYKNSEVAFIHARTRKKDIEDSTPVGKPIKVATLEESLKQINEALNEISGRPDESALDSLAKAIHGMPPKSKKTKSRKRKKVKLKRNKFMGIPVTPEDKWPDQIKLQLAYLKDKWFAGINENFLIVDDARRKLYVFSPEFKLLANMPIITGRDKGEEDVVDQEQWLIDNGWQEYYENLTKEINSGDKRRAATAKREKQKMFNMFLNHVSKEKGKVTPSGVFTLSNLKKGKDTGDRVAYGTRKYSLKPGIDPMLPIAPSGIAMHGTGIGGRKKALRKAIAAMKRGKDVVIRAESSYGCINVQNKYLEGLDDLIEEGSQVFILPEDGSIVETNWAAFENAGNYIDRGIQQAGQMIDQCFDYFTGDKATKEKQIKTLKRKLGSKSKFKLR